MRMAIIAYGNPATCHDILATEPATTVACENDAEILGRLLGMLGTHEFGLYSSGRWGWQTPLDVRAPPPRSQLWRK